MAGGDPQHPWAAGADEQARAALGLGHHVKLQAIGVVPGAGVINPVAGQQSSDDRQRLLEPVDALARAVERDPRRAIFGLVPAGPDAELEAAARQVMQARRLVRHDRRVPEVVGEHQRAHVQARCHRGRGRQRTEGGQLLAERARREVIADEQ